MTRSVCDADDECGGDVLTVPPAAVLPARAEKWPSATWKRTSPRDRHISTKETVVRLLRGIAA